MTHAAPRLETPAFFPATRATGLARLDLFAPQTGRAYAETRNHDLGPDRRSNTSVLSPFIAHRLLTEQEVVAAAVDAHGMKGAEKFVSEVYWRTYFKGWLEARPSVWTLYQQQVREDLDRLKGGGRKAYEQAVAGQTGIECFDAWADELVRTGWLHNHARMWFASIWIFTLGLPWSLGADFFYRHLLCGDPASNTLSWRWVAGLHTKGKAYAATPGNIARYTDGRFRPGPELSGHAAPLEDDWNGAPAPVPPGDTPGRGVPTLLFLHEDDLHPESIPQLEGLDVVQVAGVQCTSGRSPLPPEELPVAFTGEAVSEALRRAGEAFGAETRFLETGETVAAAAREAGAAQVVTPYAPVGPVQDRLAAEERDGLALVRVQRDYDREAWPYCTKGFFAVRKQLPGLVRSYA